jgi:brefeldin A-inhibited guanine nucleotide-exchange protein
VWQVIEKCLATLHIAIHLSATLGMTTARETTINALAKFTTLDAVRFTHIYENIQPHTATVIAVPKVRELKPKHVECIKEMLELALTEGNFLAESWEPILQCISRLAQLHLTAQGGASDEIFFSSPKETSHRKSLNTDGSSSLLGQQSGLSLSLSRRKPSRAA